jgi:hypothetical protein
MKYNAMQFNAMLSLGCHERYFVGCNDPKIKNEKKRQHLERNKLSLLMNEM